MVKAFKLEIRIDRTQFSSLFDSLELRFATCVDNSRSIWSQTSWLNRETTSIEALLSICNSFILHEIVDI